MRPQGSPGQLDKLPAIVFITRRNLARAMSALGSASDTEVIARYQQLVAAVEQAFRAEELATEHLGHRAVREQLKRHACVLSGLHQACGRIEAGELGLAREALDLLSRFLWFQRPDGLALGASIHPLRPRRRLSRHSRLARSRRPMPLLRIPGA